MHCMSNTTPPVAERRPTTFTHHGVSVTDDYAWLRDPAYPEVTDADVLSHLAAENIWFADAMAAQQPLTDHLFTEMRGRIKEADRSVPQKDGQFLYWVEYEAGAEYKKWWRRPVASSADAPDGAYDIGNDIGPDDTSADELILDETVLAQGKDYFRLGAISVSNDGRLLAWAIDDDGSERFVARIKVIASGEVMPDEIPDTLSGLVWTSDDSGFVYARVNDHWRTDTVLLHRLGTPASDDQVLFHEADEGFRVGVGLSASERWMILATGDHETSEAWLVPAADPVAPQILVRARAAGVEYDVDVYDLNDGSDPTLYIHTNDTHENFRLATASLSHPGEWTSLVEGTEDFYLTGFDLFRDFYVTEGRVRGLDRIEVRYYDDPARIEPIAFPEASYEAGLSDNPEWTSTSLRLTYESMISPATVFDYNVAARTLAPLKVQEIPSGYDPDLYWTQRLEIPARDGTLVPVSVMARRDRVPDTAPHAPAPLYLYGYGAYGMAIGPGFSTGRLSLVDRGMVFAIAHIRGGDDLGRRWYKDGKLDKRTNTFNDFVDVAKGLIDRRLTAPGRIAISGGSAGGELMGAVINSNPDLWGAVVAHVPFVDVLNTMLDETLPLTPGEWPEWGNPIEDKAAFDLIHSYSPYDQVRAQAYPPLMVTAGLNDPRVTYWEPAKWVAKLREMKTDDNVLLLKTNMGAGHGGKSGRFESLKETAEEFAFILWQLQLTLPTSDQSDV